MVTFTEIYPCTDQNRLALEMVVKICQHKVFGTRKRSVNRTQFLKKYAKELYKDAYEASDCQRLGKLDPNSQRYYEALKSLLNWDSAWQIQDYWNWYANRWSLSSFLFKPFNPIVGAMLNYALDMDCTVEEWNESIKIVMAIDLYRLAGDNVILELGDRSLKLDRFYDY